jgi:hypothetical protein
VSLSREGQTARVWLLSSGIVTAHASMPGLPGLEAAVEMASLAGSGAGPGALREAIGPKLEGIEARGLELLLVLVARIRVTPASDAARLRAVLLAAARQRRHMPKLLRVPAFQSAVAGSKLMQWLSLVDLGRVAAAGDSRQLRLYALYPGQNPASFSLPDEPVFVLDGSERAMLSRLLGVRFRPPPRKAGAGASWQRLRRALGRALRASWDGLRNALPYLAARAVPPERLSPRERRLLKHLAGRLRVHPAETLGLWNGARALVVGHGGQRRRLLPRSSPELTRALDALDAEPAWIYPVCLALLGDAARPSRADQDRWRERAPAPHEPGRARAPGAPRMPPRRQGLP